MSAPAGSDDDRLSDRLGDLFTSVAGPPKPVVAPAKQTPPPPPPSGVAAPAPSTPPAAANDTEALLTAIKGLHAHLERVEEQVNLVGQLGEELQRRLEELGRGVFDWFEQFGEWEQERFREVAQAIGKYAGDRPG